MVVIGYAHWHLVCFQNNSYDHATDTYEFFEIWFLSTGQVFVQMWL